jgi:predicted small metal-binding protein
MQKEVTCPPCGEVIRADSDEELVEAVQEHARADHQTDLTPEHILAQARTV